MSNANVIEFEARRKEGVVIADTDNGFTRIANDIMDRIYMLDISASAFRVLNAIIRQTYGFQKSTERFTNSYLQTMTGLGATSVKDALNMLADRRIITVEKSGMFKVIGLNKSVSDWQMDAGKSDNNSRTKTTQEAANPATTESRESGHNKPRIRPQKAANPAETSRESGYIKEDTLQKKLFKETQQVDQAIQVFEYWKTVMKKSRANLTPERKAKLLARLKDYPLETLMDAIDGCALSDFHMGRQPGKPEQHNDIELIFRNGSNVERFSDMKQAHQSAQCPESTDWTQNFVGTGGLV